MTEGSRRLRATPRDKVPSTQRIFRRCGRAAHRSRSHRFPCEAPTPISPTWTHQRDLSRDRRQGRRQHPERFGYWRRVGNAEGVEIGVVSGEGSGSGELRRNAPSPALPNVCETEACIVDSAFPSGLTALKCVRWREAVWSSQPNAPRLHPAGLCGGLATNQTRL